MFEVGQKVSFTDESEYEAGLHGVVIGVDEDDDDFPYLVEFYSEDGKLEADWCSTEEVEADGEEE